MSQLLELTGTHAGLFPLGEACASNARVWTVSASPMPVLSRTAKFAPPTCVFGRLTSTLFVFLQEKAAKREELAARKAAVFEAREKR